MALLINNNVTSQVLDTAGALEVIESAFAQLGRGDATFQGRTDIVSPTALNGDCYTWGSMLGAIRSPPRLAFRFKSDMLRWFERNGDLIERKFNVTPGTFMGFVLLFDTSDGALLGLLNDGELQHARVGATAGVACKHLSREDATTVGMVGSGEMARTYARAFAVVRDIEEITVYSPTTEHRDQYAKEMRRDLDVSAKTVDSAREAVRNADIAAVCTDARNTVFDRDWLEEGMFLTNTTTLEMDQRLFERDEGVYTTTTEPFMEYVIEGDDFDRDAFLEKRGARSYEPFNYPTLGELLTDQVQGRQHSSQAIFFHNMSSAIQFAAVGNLIYERAKERNLGTTIPLDWFQQDIRN